MESSPCKCANLQKIGYKSADLRKESRLRTYGSACGREQGLVHMSLTRKHFCESRHFSTPVGLHSTEVRRLPRAPHGAQWNGGGGKSRFFKLFTLLTNQEEWGKKKRAVQIYFWNSFLIKYFGFAKPMNCWLTQTSEELKFKMPSEPAGGCPPPIPSCLCTEEITLWNNGRHGVYSVSSLPASQEAQLAGPHPDSRCPCLKHQTYQDSKYKLKHFPKLSTLFKIASQHAIHTRRCGIFI